MNYVRWLVDLTDYPILKIVIIITTVSCFLALCFILLDKLSVKTEKLHAWKEKITKKVVLIVIAVVVFLSGFYWIFVRPTYARKACNKKALDYASESKTNTSNNYELFYKICLRNKGL